MKTADKWKLNPYTNEDGDRGYNEYVKKDFSSESSMNGFYEYILSSPHILNRITGIINHDFRKNVFFLETKSHEFERNDDYLIRCTGDYSNNAIIISLNGKELYSKYKKICRSWAQARKYIIDLINILEDMKKTDNNMTANIKVAKELVKLAKNLMAGDQFNIDQALQNISKDNYNYLTLIGYPKVITFDNGYKNIFIKFIFSYSYDDITDLSYVVFDDLFQDFEDRIDEFLENQINKGYIDKKPEKNKIKDFINDYFKKVVLKQDYTLDARYNLSFSETPDSLLAFQKTHDITFNNIKYSSIKELCKHYNAEEILYGRHLGVISECDWEIKYENVKNINLNKKFKSISDILKDITESMVIIDISDRFNIYLKQNIDNIL